GRDLARDSDAALSDLRRERLGIVHQDFHLLEHLPVWLNVTLRMVPAGATLRARPARAEELLGEAGLGGAPAPPPPHLSRGPPPATGRRSRSRARCAAGRRSWSRTSRPRTSTPRPAARSRPSSRTSATRAPRSSSRRTTRPSPRAPTSATCSRAVRCALPDT